MAEGLKIVVERETIERWTVADDKAGVLFPLSSLCLCGEPIPLRMGTG